jgi:uncharacterized protein YdeI (YjbR/CyaY-like superfamily)
MSGMPNPKFFLTADDFRKWLEKNHEKKSELLVGFYKVGSGKRSMTWSESVDQALCFGWIDGVRKSIDEDSYCIRFSRRRPKSIWSAINIQKVKKLLDKGLMRKAGIAAFARRDENRSEIYSYENESKNFEKDLENEFRKNKDAWTFFQNQPQGYKRVCIHYVMSAKQQKTRTGRLNKLILASKAGQRL